MTAYRFTGTERVTIELAGTFEPAALAVPAGLVLDRTADGRARVSLFAFFVDDLRITGFPLVRASYAEVLWRIAVRHGDTPAWWVVACDLAARGPAWTARRWVRYPVRRAAVEVQRLDQIAPDDHALVSVIHPAGGLSLWLGPPGDPGRVEQRRLLTGDLYEVPWGDDASGARRAGVRARTDTLGRLTVGADIAWDDAATVRHGRAHRCGVAERR